MVPGANRDPSTVGCESRWLAVRGLSGTLVWVGSASAPDRVEGAPHDGQKRASSGIDRLQVGQSIPGLYGIAAAEVADLRLAGGPSSSSKGCAAGNFRAAPVSGLREERGVDRAGERSPMRLNQANTRARS